MRDITSKISSLRQAEAIGGVFCSPEILEIIKRGKLPKGEPFGIAEAAALLASKQTHHLIPHCHPVRIDGLQIKFYFSDNEHLKTLITKPKTGIYIWAKGQSVGNTGIEMEILTAISTAALTLYDLIKPLGQKNIEIGQIRLLEKKGGKSDKPIYPEKFRKSVILGKPNVQTKGVIFEILTQKNIKLIQKNETLDFPKLEKNILRQIKKQTPLILIIHENNDELTPFLEHLFDRKLNGMIHAMYQHNANRYPLSIHSSLMAGQKDQSIIISLPDSYEIVKTALESIISSIFHLLHDSLND